MVNQNPSTMSDEELDAALDEAGIKTSDAPEPDKEEPETPENPEADPAKEAEPKENPEEQPDPEKPEEDEEDPDKKPDKPSRREQLRIQDLLRKYPPKQEPKAPAKETKQPEGLLDLDKELDADDALKERLKKDRDAAAKAAAEQARSETPDVAAMQASMLFHTRLEVDAPKVEVKYPVLDKDSDKFKPALAKAINQMYLDQCGYDFDADTVTNSNLRYSDFVEAMFELGDEIGSEKAVETKKQVVKRAAQTGLRPDGSTPTKMNLNKLPGQMSDEELDAIIAQAVPSK